LVEEFTSQKALGMTDDITKNKSKDGDKWRNP